MNDDQFQDMLADYLSGELDADRAAEFRAELESNEQRRRLAEELQAAAAALESNLISEEQAEAAVGSLAWDDIENQTQPHADPVAGRTQPGYEQASPHSRRWAGVLRYAAIIAFAFGGGYLSRGRETVEQTTPASLAPPAFVSAPLNEEYVAKYVKAAREYPQSSTFTRSLLMVARR